MFKDAIKAYTTNGMVAEYSTKNACLDLFSSIGSSFEGNVYNLFLKAMDEDSDKAIRIVLWARDIRNGAGRRAIARTLFNAIESRDKNLTIKLIPKIVELGRWDDILVFKTKEVKYAAYTYIKQALRKGDALCAKWMPREKSAKREQAVELRKFLGLTAKQYRKLLAMTTNVVESKMCAKDWDSIDFNSVPSIASLNYRKAFLRNCTHYKEYLEDLASGKAKVNAQAVYPYQILNYSTVTEQNETTGKLIQAQWDALPNYLSGQYILPMVDTSGSMLDRLNNSISVMDVAISLGIYIADKNIGQFKDVILTFSEDPELKQLFGSIFEKYLTVESLSWGMNTDIVKAFKLVLKTAIKGNVPDSDMPKTLLIISDMQFDASKNHAENSALDEVDRLYTKKGYTLPKVVFWNVAYRGNFPAVSDSPNVAIVSGFSPAVLKAVLDNDLSNITPLNIMLDTIMQERYNV